MSIVGLRNGKKFECSSEQTVLQAAFEAGLTLEHSCKTGRCGVCSASLLGGSGGRSKPQNILTEVELDEGKILTCCYMPTTDIEIDIVDLGGLTKNKVMTLPCRINSIERVSPDVVQVVLRTPPNSSLAYLPGQYIDIIGKNGLRRSYSIANAPRQDGNLNLHIREVEDGMMSRYWFHEAQVNDLLRLEGPLGTFCLRDITASYLILLATGTGIAPISGILESLKHTPEKNRYSEIYVYWGGRYEHDFYFNPEEIGVPIKYEQVLSGSRGKAQARYVQHAVLDDCLNLNDAVVYACGSAEMIHDAKKLLTKSGLADQSFYSDAFVSSS